MKKILPLVVIIWQLVAGSFSAKAQYNVLLNFNGENSPQGSAPWGDLTLVGNKFYGMTQYGGAYNYGCIFSVDTDGNGYNDMLDFNGSNGSWPQGSLICASGVLYGITQGSSLTINDGTIFSIDTNGSGFKILLTFNYQEMPHGSLTLSGSRLYGMTYTGGNGHQGNVFSLDTNGTGVKDLHDFSYTAGNGLLDDGATPNGNVTIIGSKLYGMTKYGGDVGRDLQGTIFSMDTNGNNYKIIYRFDGITGGDPWGSLLYSAGKFYGMTSGDESPYDTARASLGNIFSIDTDGGNYKDIFGFASVNDYGAPHGSLTISGNTLYGMTQSNIFLIDTTGNGYVSLFNFVDTTSNLSTYGDVTLSGGKLYGMTAFGGPIDSGAIFSFCIINVAANVTANVSCYGGSNGSALASSATGVISYNWAPLGGTNAIASGLSAGTYTVTVANSNGCTATASVIITQPAMLSVSANRITNAYCNGSNNGVASVIDSGGVPPYTYSWLPAGGSMDTASGLSTGSYTVVVSDLCGSSQSAVVSISFDTAYVAAYPFQDTIYFSPDSSYISLYCNVPATFSWAPSSGLSCANCPSPSASPTVTTTYTITTTTTCGDVMVDTLTLYVDILCTNSYTEPICIITIDTVTNKSKVIWGRTNSPPAGGYGFYNVYRDSASSARPIDSQPLDSLSEFVDASSNPSAGVQTYQLSTVDSCGESALSAPCSSIFLTTTQGTHAYIMTWTPYVGFTPVRYRIFRGPSMSQLTQIDSVPNNVYAYVDSFPPANVFYVLEAVSPSGICTPTTHGPNGHNLNISLLSGSFSNGFNTAILGLQNVGNTNNGLKVYPNPSTGIVNGKLSMVNENPRMEVYNVLGEQIQQFTIYNSQFTIDLSSQPNGVYFYRVVTESGNLVGEGKLIIQK